MYEQFKNEFLLNLNSLNELSIEQLALISKTLDISIYNYDIIKKETELVVYNDELPQLAKMYIVTKKIEGYSEQTLYNYTRTLRLFFFTLKKQPENVTTNDVRLYLYNYQEERNITNRTLDKIRDCLDAFYEWLYNENYIERNPLNNIKKIKYEKKPKQPLTQLELECVRKACKTLKEKAIIETLYSTGCRVAELCNLKKSDINWDDKSVHLFGKNSKHRTSYLNAKAELAIQEYLFSRTDDSEYLFVSDRYPYEEMHNCGIEKIVRNVANRTNISKPITPHIFTHTMASHMIQRDCSIDTIQTLLGHANINTTMVYAHNCVDNVKTEHSKYII